MYLLFPQLNNGILIITNHLSNKEVLINIHILFLILCIICTVLFIRKLSWTNNNIGLFVIFIFFPKDKFKGCNNVSKLKVFIFINLTARLLLILFFKVLAFFSMYFKKLCFVNHFYKVSRSRHLILKIV